MSKKFILFIVEGKNDERELNAMLKTPYFAPYLEHYVPYFLPKGGDITTAAGAKAENIQKTLNEMLMFFRRHTQYNNIRVQDIQEIVQIVDLDGVFIPPSCIVRGTDSKFFYEPEVIRTSNVDGAKGRNSKKAKILKKLVEVNQVGNVPYSVYFASRDMDHVLFNEPNAQQKSKDSSSFRFANLCSKRPECLLETIFKQGIMAEKNYADSWADAQEGTNSLKRRTNINLFFGGEAKHPK